MSSSLYAIVVRKIPIGFSIVGVSDFRAVSRIMMHPLRFILSDSLGRVKLFGWGVIGSRAPGAGAHCTGTTPFLIGAGMNRPQKTLFHVSKESNLMTSSSSAVATPD